MEKTEEVHLENVC